MARFAGALAAALVFGTLPAQAASSAWQQAEGANLRLVTTGLPDASGTLRGVLQIDLQPGWTTYWIDPGETGVAPSFQLGPGSSGSVEVGFPPPKHLQDGATGYDAPVSLPLTIRLGASGTGASPAPGLALHMFVGLCRQICIPFQAVFALDPAEGADDPIDAAAVADAFAALPQAARPGFRATARADGPQRIRVKAELPAGAETAEFFMAGDDAYTLGRPVKVSASSGEALFAVDILTRPQSPQGRHAFRYVLKAGGKAVAGTLTIEAL